MPWDAVLWCSATVTVCRAVANKAQEHVRTPPFPTSPGQTVLPTRPTPAEYKIKTCIGGWPNDTAKSSQLARNHQENMLSWNDLVVQMRSRSHNNNKQLGGSWLTWPNGGKLGSSWAKIWPWSNSTQSIQLEPSGWANDTQLHRSVNCSSVLELASELGRPFGQGFWAESICVTASLCN